MVKWVNELSAIDKEVDPKYFYRQIFQHHLHKKVEKLIDNIKDIYHRYLF